MGRRQWFWWVSVGGVGLAPRWAGTCGSIVASILAWLGVGLAGWIGMAAATLLVAVFGTMMIKGYLDSSHPLVSPTTIAGSPSRSCRDYHDHDDPSEIVIDEVAGCWLASTVIGVTITLFPVSTLEPWLREWGLALALMLFRIFDGVKMGPVAWAERLPGALGVMMDDLIAGAIAGILGSLLVFLGWWGLG